MVENNVKKEYPSSIYLDRPVGSIVNYTRIDLNEQDPQVIAKEIAGAREQDTSVILRARNLEGNDNFFRGHNELLLELCREMENQEMIPAPLFFDGVSVHQTLQVTSRLLSMNAVPILTEHAMFRKEVADRKRITNMLDGAIPTWLKFEYGRRFGLPLIFSDSGTSD